MVLYCLTSASVIYSIEMLAFQDIVGSFQTFFQTFAMPTLKAYGAHDRATLNAKIALEVCMLKCAQLKACEGRTQV